MHNLHDDEPNPRSLSGDAETSEVTSSDYFSDPRSADSAAHLPLSAEMLMFRPDGIFWEVVHNVTRGSDVFSAIPGEWRDVVLETFRPLAPTVQPRDIPPDLRELYVEATRMMHLRTEDAAAPLRDNTHIIETSLAVIETSRKLRSTLDNLPKWIEKCYLPLLRCAFSSNDFIEDLSLHMSAPASERLCDDVFRDESLAVLQTDSAWIPGALRLSNILLTDAVPELPRALLSAESSQLSPRHVRPGEAQGLELFSTLIDWHPHHLGICYHNRGNTDPGLWRHSRMAATSPARHLHWLGIKAPVIVVQFDFEKVSFHLNWQHLSRGRLRSISAAFLHPGFRRAKWWFADPFQTWDLRNPAQAIEVGLILSNIDRYTSGHFLDEVAHRFAEGDSFNCGPRPWKIDVNILPTSMIEVEGSLQWKEEQERSKDLKQPPDIRAWLEGVC